MTATRAQPAIVLDVVSFGYNYAWPAELISTPPHVLKDVRQLANPYKRPEYHDLTGLDHPTRAFVLGQPEAEGILDRTHADAAELACGSSRHHREGRVTVAFGCSGGKDRSPSLAIEFVRRERQYIGLWAAVTVRHLHVHLRAGADQRSELAP